MDSTIKLVLRRISDKWSVVSKEPVEKDIVERAEYVHVIPVMAGDHFISNYEVEEEHETAAALPEGI